MRKLSMRKLFILSKTLSSSIWYQSRSFIRADLLLSMAASNPTPSYEIPNGADPSRPFTFLNIHNTIKLQSTNYLSWKLQVEAILICHGLYKFVDGTFPCPPPVLTPDGTETPNPDRVYWIRQDKFLFGALVGTLSQPLVPLISRTTSSHTLWVTLAKTYALLSRGHIKQLKDQLNRTTKGNSTKIEFLHAIKACADQLASLGKPMDHEELIDRILLGLDDSYTSVIESVNARDNPISFEELHEKLINKELLLNQTRSTFNHPATTLVAVARPPHRPPGRNILPPPSPSHPRPFLGKCQWCREQGHLVSHYPVFTARFPITTPPPTSNSTNRPSTSKPQANVANLPSTSSSQWLLDSGASHHITNDLNNLSLHTPYDGTEELIIGDGTGLHISHIGSLTISYVSHSITLNNVLFVPSMSRNVVSISQLCRDNNASIEFLSHSFVVKDLKTGASLFQGPGKSGVYELSTPPQVFTSTSPSSLDWHHRLGHPSNKDFRHLISRNNLNVSSISTLDCNACACNKSHKLPFHVSSISSTAPLQYVYTDYGLPLFSLMMAINTMLFLSIISQSIRGFTLSN